MKEIIDILNEYSNKKNSNLYSYLKIANKWNIIMGDVLSKICYPSFFRNGILSVNVIDSVWANEIMMNKIKIFNNIKNETNIVVYNLVTRIDDINNNNFDNNTKKNYVKKTVTEEHKRWADETIKESNIEDEKMREKFYNILLEAED
ncbi:hypothetical protein WESB_0764 [Brachyspira pilosicoli WesB]|uniref:DUF721 domain-containing protein n=3 Tax=Brachyspira pilosicoli TaxID=52584 RepID=A0A3B6VKH6_BRAPL|nr:DUF721 domain-containing protein [Brachyspira pilosicoli]AGA66413.1 hypothetical protein BPP43_05845 [Brachyspira pilosicoli P43/6/78]MBW5382197.1 DUF721 domain-containing protein [Brachyspira pilosicoli]PLV63518.1 hypothetical protein BPSP16_03080 [Brachyspira pilosicoli SP16]WIH86876.1 DUF721 domain-containing protein [Brachyspira pilosicoli]WIH91378.1 DUF721 domain-containing protein [Brachyspira pilosicoli]